MNWLWRGRAWVFGDDVPNDNGLVPISFVRAQEYDPAVLAKHAFADVDALLAARIQRGDILVGGRNFGRGNPHVQGFLALKGLGVAVLAESMQRGPLRACVNSGVPVLAPAPGLTSFVSDGDVLCVDFENGVVINETGHRRMQIAPLPALMREIIALGGGIGFMHRRLEELRTSAIVRGE
jgi:3-isopropylmalate/(R)-2-methylmalate dehydratase small subunit